MGSVAESGGEAAGLGVPDPGPRKRRLRATLAVTLSVLVLEVIGGFVSGSLSLVADANHMFADVVALTLAYAATALAGRAPTRRHTFGFARAEILAAFVNAQLLLVVCAWLIYETYQRFRSPTGIRLGIMVPVAVVGLAANLISMAILSPEKRRSLNVRAAFTEVVMDAAGSLAVLAAGFGIARTGWLWLDPAASGLIAIFVLPRAVGFLRQSAHILLEGAPGEIDVESLRREILAVPGVEGAHDLHFWTLSSGLHSASLHICAAAESPRGQVLHDVQVLLRERAGVEHATIQVETGPARDCYTAPDHA
ncbi:MAG TPA: cation diffusion facilitator family transporter [Thermoanaerobaculia bacterium]|nr:cation diffusion facilitator family transporter [Thermoanaerobaculia bacterium]